MKQKFRLTQPDTEHIDINQQDGLDEEDLALAYQLCSTLRLLDDATWTRSQVRKAATWFSRLSP